MALRKFESSGAGRQVPDTDRTGYKKDIQKMIKEHANGAPRQVQTTMGPSSVGNACDRSLVGSLSGLYTAGESTGNDNPWFSVLGTSVHAWMADMLSQIPGWLVEVRVEVGRPSVPHGTADGFHPEMGVVLDWKLLGKSGLDGIRDHGPSRVYREQLHVYGYGLERMGYNVKEVLLVALPRNPSAVLPFLHEMQLWSEPYNERLAVSALDRVDKLQQEALKLRALKARDLLSIEATPGKDCHWCPFNKPSICPDGIKS